MPITPVHLGPAFALSLIFRHYLDVIVFFVASLIVDLEPILLFLFGQTTSFYFSHNFFFGALIGVVTAYAVLGLRRLFWHLQPYVLPVSNWRPKKEVGRKKLLFSGIVGVWSHVIFDMFASTDIRPFYPFSLANPFGHILSSGEVYFFSLALLVVAIIVGGRLMFKRSLKQEPAFTSEGFNVL